MVTFCGTPLPAVVELPVHSVPTLYGVDVVLYTNADEAPYTGAFPLALPESFN